MKATPEGDLYNVSWSGQEVADTKWVFFELLLPHLIIGLMLNNGLVESGASPERSTIVDNKETTRVS